MERSRNRYPDEIRLILWQLLALVVRTAAFGAAVGIHVVVHNYLLPVAIPPGAHRYLLTPFEVLFFAAFAVMYVQQIFDMATIFVPWLRQKPPVADLEPENAEGVAD